MKRVAAIAMQIITKYMKKGGSVKNRPVGARSTETLGTCVWDETGFLSSVSFSSFYLSTRRLRRVHRYVKQAAGGIDWCSVYHALALIPLEPKGVERVVESQRKRPNGRAFRLGAAQRAPLHWALQSVRSRVQRRRSSESGQSEHARLR